MKAKSVIVCLIIFLLPIGAAQSSEPTKPSGKDSIKKDFHFLSGYGEWLEVASYGTSWKPFVVSSWNPFERGHWISTDSGLVWVSYEPFGWITSHYGNWIHDAKHGWIWIPGSHWSAAQVTWIQYGDSIAWAPAPPAGTKIPDPWESSTVGLWKVVRVSNVNRPDIKVHLSKEKPLPPVEGATVKRETPKAGELPGITKTPIKLHQEQKLSRIDFPVAVKNQISAYQADVSRNVILRKSADKAEKKTPEKIRDHNIKP